MWRVERLVFMTLTLIHWVPVQDIGSKILCEKLGTVKITPSDCLHQEYLTINLGSTSDWWQLQLPLVRLCWRWGGRCWATGAAWGGGRGPGSLNHSLSLSLPIHVSDISVNSQDGSIFRMQGAEGCVISFLNFSIFPPGEGFITQYTP